MKRYVFLGLVVVALLAMTSVALAGGYLNSVPGGGSPHGNYSDSGTKCKVCHAVHNASATGAVLLRGTRAGACVYCHLTNTYGVYRPYGSTLSNYESESAFNHTDGHNAFAGYSGCVSCHTVHGAYGIGSAAIGGSDDSTDGDNYILKTNPGGGVSGNATNQIDFCRDCHNKQGNADSGECFETCHTQDNETDGNISSEYFTRDRDGITHVMTSTLTAPSAQQVAWTESAYCKSCHSAGPFFTAGNSFPHYTPSNAQFLPDYATENTDLDAVCLQCHVQGGDGDNYTTGVGKTF
jgi:predicted CXXCH cytochrome family protein